MTDDIIFQQEFLIRIINQLNEIFKNEDLDKHVNEKDRQ